MTKSKINDSPPQFLDPPLNAEEARILRLAREATQLSFSTGLFRVRGAPLREGWFRPQDIGGFNSSNHARILARLVNRMLISRVHLVSSPKSWSYRALQNDSWRLNLGGAPSIAGGAESGAWRVRADRSFLLWGSSAMSEPGVFLPTSGKITVWSHDPLPDVINVYVAPGSLEDRPSNYRIAANVRCESAGTTFTLDPSLFGRNHVLSVKGEPA